VIIAKSENKGIMIKISQFGHKKEEAQTFA
jgi:hypothetical protein